MSITDVTVRGVLNYEWYYGPFKNTTPWSFTLQQGQGINSHSPTQHTLYDKTGLVSFAVIYKKEGSGNIVLWETNTNIGTTYGPYQLNMIKDGNASLLTKLSKDIWSSQSTGLGGAGLYFTQLKTNGQLLVRDKYREIIWFSVNKHTFFSPDLESEC